MNEFKLQRFAEGDGTSTTTTPTGANNEKGVRTYGMQFKELLPAVFAKSHTSMTSLSAAWRRLMASLSTRKHSA
ncbi:hypothetical protein [Allobaculum sp. Allo2]|uniref:hypothetical protein n=1 Tax=Allobaculum sp. Allo2 TaxID=2853432 RepID=UPI001F604BEF|nr:hypothetical protein [Allobaculum sp. Allo2]UNT92612.1 hypothetical protein KWG61_10810 [Allobaculum sp. Allo2]